MAKTRDGRPEDFFSSSETLAAGVRVYVACIPVKLMLGDKLLGAFAGGDPILGAILLFVLISLVYTFVGGVKAVIWTDAVQFALFLLGGLFTLWFVPHVFPGGAAAVIRIAADAGKLHWLNAHVTAGSVWREPMNIWMGVVGGTFMVMASHGAEQLIVQRVLACKSVRDGRKALVLSAVVIFPLFLVFLLVGAMLWAYYQKFAMPFRYRKSGRQRHQGQRFRLSHFHVDCGAAHPEGPADSRHSGCCDVVGQLRLDGAVVGFDDGFCKEGAARKVRRIFFAFQQSLDCVLGDGAYSCCLYEPACRICAECVIYP